MSHYDRELQSFIARVEATEPSEKARAKEFFDKSYRCGHARAADAWDTFIDEFRKSFPRVFDFPTRVLDVLARTLAKR